MKKIIISLLLLFVITLLSAYGTESDIVGTWRSGDTLITFNDDGTAIQKREADGPDEEMSCYEIKNGKLYGGESKTELEEVGDVEIEDDILTIKAKDGETYNWSRVK